MSTLSEAELRLLTEPITRITQLSQIEHRIKKVVLLRNWQRFVGKFNRVDTAYGDTIPVEFRNGVKFLLRAKTQDIAILHEVWFEGAYASVEKVLKKTSGPVTVLDIGAHAGLYTIRCLAAAPNIYVDSYEPGTDNRAALERNVAANPRFANRSKVYAEAVSGTDGTARYFHEPRDTVSSGLYGKGDAVEVPVVSLKTAISRCKYPIALAKIDIEGAEYELLDGSDKEDWAAVQTVMAEVHPDPKGKSTPEDWLCRMFEHGFSVQKREYSTVLLVRPAIA